MRRVHAGLAAVLRPGDELLSVSGVPVEGVLCAQELLQAALLRACCAGELLQALGHDVPPTRHDELSACRRHDELVRVRVRDRVRVRVS